MQAIRNVFHAHPANETILDPVQRSVLCSALAMYQRECMGEAKSQRQPSLHVASVRRVAEQTWSNRANVAHDLYDMLLPLTPGPTPTVRIVR